MKTAPAWVDHRQYPFQSQWIEIDEYELHYIDEGKGNVILFIHGTPEWSFGYRELVKELRNEFRCIAIDLLGFGLSEKPPGEVYSCLDHAKRLEKFIQKLDLRNISIVANDFGGSIGLNYAINHSDNINAIILFNTWMWSLRNDKHYAGPAKLMNSWLGKLLYLQFNFPVNVIMPSAFADKEKLTRSVHKHYKNALPDSMSRKGAYTFSKELMKASDWWQSLWEQAEILSGKPSLIFWGMKDKFIPSYELDKWRSKFPHAEVVVFDDAGHFVQEEKPNEMSAAIKNFLNSKNVSKQEKIISKE